MDTLPRVELPLARHAAEALIDALRPACIEAAIAGEVRRAAAPVTRIDLVVAPRVDRCPFDLFGEPEAGWQPTFSRLDSAIASMIATFELCPAGDDRPHEYTFVGGRSRWSALRGVPLHLWAATPISYGAVLAMATGCTAYARAISTEVDRGGALLNGHAVGADGHLIRWGEVVHCPTEGSFFAAIGVEMLPPEQRTGRAAQMLRTEAANKYAIQRLQGRDKRQNGREAA